MRISYSINKNYFKQKWYFTLVLDMHLKQLQLHNCKGNLNNDIQGAVINAHIYPAIKS